MFKRTLLLLVIVGGAAGLLGCSAGEGARIGMNLHRKDSHVKVFLDGYEAKQNMVKKGATGYAKFKISEQVSPAPTLRFEIEDPDKFGRIMTVSLQIHQAFESDYSHQAEFVVWPAKGKEDRDAQLKPGKDYSLGNLGADFKVFDVYGKETSGVKLEPGKKYLMVFTVNADKSESTQIYFEVGANSKPASQAAAEKSEKKKKD